MVGDAGDHAVAALLETLDQGFGIDAVDRLLARRVDGRDIDDVGVVEGALEVVHQVAKAGVAVGLDDGDHATLGAFPGGGEDGFDLDRMMAVIVDDGDRSEEHTSELQSLMRSSYDVFCLKKNTNITYTPHIS